MKIKSYSLLLFFAILAALGCQRDDICPETQDTTPLLIIRFYDIEEPEVLKAPQNLGIIENCAEGQECNEEYVTIRNRSNRDQIVTFERFTGDSLAIPLKTDEDLTAYKFILNNNAADQEPDPEKDTDVITFTYGRQEEYINRACAFRVNYVGLKVDVQDSDGTSWIQDIQVEQTNIEDQNQAHVSIFF